MEKIFNQKNFNNFVWSPLGSRRNIYRNFCLQVHFHVCSLILFPLFATGVHDTGDKFAAGIIDTGGIDTGGNLPPVSLTPVANNGNNIRLLTPENELEGKNLYIRFLYYPKVTKQNY